MVASLPSMRSVSLRLLLAGALLVLGLGIAVAVAGGRSPALRAVPPAADAEPIVAAFTKLTRATDWQLVKRWRCVLTPTIPRAWCAWAIASSCQPSR